MAETNNPAIGIPKSASLPIPTQAIVQNQQPIPVITGKVATPKIKKIRVFTILLIFILFICSGIGVTIFGLREYLRKTYNPVISPLLEDYLLTTQEQYLTRTNNFSELIVSAIATEAPEMGFNYINGLNEEQLSTYKTYQHAVRSQFDYQLSFKGGIKMQFPEEYKSQIKSLPVQVNDPLYLGLLSEIWTRGEIKNSGTIDITNPSKIAHKADFNAKAFNDNYSSDMRLSTVTKNGNSYFKVNSGNNISNVDLTNTYNKWLVIKQEDLNKYAPTINISQPEVIDQNLTSKIFKTFTLNSFVSRLKRVENTITSTRTDICYNAILDKQAISTLKEELNTLSEKSLSESLANNIEYIDTLDITICYAKNMPIITGLNIKEKGEYNNEGIAAKMEIEFLLTIASKTTPIDIIEPVTNIVTIDELIEYYNNLLINSYPQNE